MDANETPYRVQWTCDRREDAAQHKGKIVGDMGHTFKHSQGKYIAERWCRTPRMVSHTVNRMSRHYHGTMGIFSVIVTYFENGVPYQEVDGYCWRSGLRIPRPM